MVLTVQTGLIHMTIPKFQWMVIGLSHSSNWVGQESHLVVRQS
jgi:hypothetical protein